MSRSYDERSSSAWDHEYAELRAYTTSYRTDLDRGVHYLLEYLRSRSEPLAEPILDLGCGIGRNLLPLLASGYRLIGVDHSGAALAKLRARAAERQLDAKLQLLRHDLGQPLPFEAEAAGTVLDVTAIDNLVDGERLDRYGFEVARVLRVGGLALVVTFGRDDGYYGRWLEDSPWRHDHVVEDPNTGIRNRLFTHESLERVFSPCLRSEARASLVFIDDAAGVPWTRRFLIQLFRKNEGTP